MFLLRVLIKFKTKANFSQKSQHFNFQISNFLFLYFKVSNCEATAGASQRFDYGQRLVEAGLKLDGYGECWNNTIIESPWHGDHGEPGLISKERVVEHRLSRSISPQESWCSC